MEALAAGWPKAGRKSLRQSFKGLGKKVWGQEIVDSRDVGRNGRFVVMAYGWWARPYLQPKATPPQTEAVMSRKVVSRPNSSLTPGLQ